jgi:hypothetical protein
MVRYTHISQPTTLDYFLETALSRDKMNEEGALETDSRGIQTIAENEPDATNPPDTQATVKTDVAPPIFRAIAIPSSLRSIAPFLEEAQAHAG